MISFEGRLSRANCRRLLAASARIIHEQKHETILKPCCLKQDFVRVDAEEMDALVKREAIEAYHDREMGERLRPAVMFRLCTKMCNHVRTVAEEGYV